LLVYLLTGKLNVYDEFIELYNPSDTAIPLTGWYLQKKTSQAEDYSSLVPEYLLENKTVLPQSYF